MDIDKFQEIMNLGIKREIEAYEFYKDVAKKVQNPTIKEMFEELSREELGHKDLLDKFKYNPEMPVKMSAPKTDYHLAESVEMPELSSSMKPADALALAMKKEQMAAEFYNELANQTDDAEIKKLILEMANMELSHKQRLENAYTNIAYIEAF